MTIASLTLSFLVPGSGSLKDKRQVVRSIKDRIRSRFNVSVAEVDHQDLWQRGTLGIAVVSTDGHGARVVLEQIIRLAEQDVRLSVLDATIEFH